MASIQRATAAKRLTETQQQDAIAAFVILWELMYFPQPTDALVILSGKLGLQYSLKGCDAFQLASALEAQATWFVCADTVLNKVGRKNGLSIWNPATHRTPRSLQLV